MMAGEVASLVEFSVLIGDSGIDPESTGVAQLRAGLADNLGMTASRRQCPGPTEVHSCRTCLCSVVFGHGRGPGAVLVSEVE